MTRATAIRLARLIKSRGWAVSGAYLYGGLWAVEAHEWDSDYEYRLFFSPYEFYKVGRG